MCQKKNWYGRAIQGGGGLLADGWREVVCVKLAAMGLSTPSCSVSSVEWCRTHVLAVPSIVAQSHRAGRRMDGHPGLMILIFNTCELHP